MYNLLIERVARISWWFLPPALSLLSAACATSSSIPASATGELPTPPNPPSLAATLVPPTLGPAPRIPPGPGQPSPDGPWNRDVLALRSNDGLTFGQSTTAFERAGVPDLILEPSGRLVAVFQWFPFDQREAFDRVAVAFSSDGGRSWSTPVAVDVAGMPADLQRPFDPTIVQLPDGRYRLYFTSSPRSTGSAPAIYSAVSRDALRFDFEPAPRFAPPAGTVDASIVFFRGRWHLFSHNQTANTGRGFHAESQDGLAFTQLADVDVGQGRQWIGNALVVGERLRYYGSGAGGIWSAVSTDGAAWAVEPGIRLNGGDPSAIIVGDGEVVLLAVGPPRADAGPAPFSGSAR